MKIKANKKGVFYTLSVVIVIIILLLVFSNKLRVLNFDEEFSLERAKIISMDRFASDFDNYYAKNIIETATTPALIAITEHDAPFTNVELIDVMDDGSGVAEMDKLFSTDNNFNQSLRTLTFELDKALFTYEIDDIKQVNYTTLVVSFNVDYHFSSFNTTWETTDKIINITVPVFGLWHPNHAGAYIDTDWVEDPTPIDCYANQISIDSSDCITDINIMPPP
jgi:hypothetical protein